MEFRVASFFAVFFHLIVLPSITTVLLLKTITEPCETVAQKGSSPEPATIDARPSRIESSDAHDTVVRNTVKLLERSDDHPRIRESAELDGWWTIVHVRGSTLVDALSHLRSGGDRILVAMREERFVGYEIDFTTPRSPLRNLGFFDGDVVHGVNGCQLFYYRCLSFSDDILDFTVTRGDEKGHIIVMIVDESEYGRDGTGIAERSSRTNGTRPALSRWALGR